MTTVLKSFYENCKEGKCANWSVSTRAFTETTFEGKNTLVIDA